MTPARTRIAALISQWRSARSRPKPARPAHNCNARLWLIAVLVAAVAAAGWTAAAGAGCNEDCRSEYVSALGECRVQYEKGNENLQDLEDCLVDTRGEYDDCIDDCTSMGAGGVVACKSSDRALRPVSLLAPARNPSSFK